MRYLIFLLTLFFLTNQSVAQSAGAEEKEDFRLSGKPLFFQYKLHVGAHVYSGKSLSEYLGNGYYANEFRFGWQTTGEKTWHQALNFPLYGLGFYHGRIGDESVLGKPDGLYGFVHFPFWRRQRHHVDMDMAVGLSYHLAPYDANLNPENDAISAPVSVYFCYSIGGNWMLSKAFDFTYGLDITHFSNGRTHTPNYGLNMVGLNGGLRYHFNSMGYKKVPEGMDRPLKRPDLPHRIKPVVDKESRVSVYASGGVAMYQLPEDEGGPSGPRYFTSSVYAEYALQLNAISTITAGVDWFYDGSLEQNYNRDIAYGGSKPNDLMLGGLHVGHALGINKLSLETHLGTYFYSPHDFKGGFFVRVSARYNITPNLFGQIGLKTMNGFVADWIEWGVGYTVFRKTHGHR